MKGNKFTAFFLVGLLITIAFAAVLPMIGAEPPTKGPDVKTGHITADETWDQDYEIYNLVIDEGITVTVNAGVGLYMTTDTWFYIEGTLIFNGTQAALVNLFAMSNGATWNRFQTNSTGTFDLQNFTISDSTTSSTSFTHKGQPSIFKNGLVTGGFQGLYLWSDGGDRIENITFLDCHQDGIYVRENTQTTYIKDINVVGVGRGALMFESSEGCIVDGMVATDYTFYAVYTWESFGLHLNDIDVGSSVGNGFVHVNGIGDYHVADAIVREGPIGVMLNVLEGSSVNYTRLTTTTNVNIGVQTYSASYGTGDFTDCDLQAAINPVKLISSGPPQRVNLLNTTWTWERDFVTSGNVFLNINWYLDVQLVNGLGSPINGTLMITPTGSGQVVLKILPYGKGSKIEVKDRSIPDTITPGGIVEYYSNDLLFTYEGNPEDQILLENMSFSNYTYLYQMMDLKPTIDLPETLETDEDAWGELPLDELIVDPEGESLDIEAESDPNIHVNLVHGGSTLKFKNEIENWYGTGWINLTIADGENTIFVNMTVIVHSVNDAPNFIQTPPELVLDEDSWTYFNFTGKVVDAEGSPIEITFLENELYTWEYNKTTMNLTIMPAENVNGLVQFEVNLSDGEVWTFENLILNITPVNDAPELNSPEDWNITLKKGNQTTINLTSMLFDVEGDNLTVSVYPSTHATVDGFLITIGYEVEFSEDRDQINITVSDGNLTDLAKLTIYLTGDPVVGDDDDDDIIPPDDDDVNDTVGSIKIVAGEDSWSIEVEGDEGQTLYFVVEDSEDGKTSFPLTYSNGKYRADIPADEAGEGNGFWISIAENGEPLANAPQGTLPELKEKEDEPFPVWIIFLILAVLIIMIVVVIILVTRGKGEEEHEE